MNVQALLSLNTIPSIILSFIFLYSCLKAFTNFLNPKSKIRTPPQVGGGWPLIGHLHHLGGSKPAHRTLASMANTYGPIFTIKLGVYRALVVSNHEIAKQCLTTNDKVFAGRPNTLASEILAYDGAMFAFRPYGPYWRQTRKIATHELLSSHRLESLRHVRESEIVKSQNELYKLCKSGPVVVEMENWFSDLTLNILFRVIVGKRYTEGCTFKELLKHFIKLFGKFAVADALPFLRWLDIGGDEKVMKKTAKELELVFQELLDEHKRKRLTGDARVDEDFMDVMISSFEGQENINIEGHSTDTIIKATCMVLLFAATDATTVTLAWALSLLVNNCETLIKVQQELDSQIGKERLVINESDTKSLVYLDAVIKETLRLYPAGPIMIPHNSTQDCTVAGYHVPTNTRLFVNVWKIHRDPTVWENPQQFKPERFLTTHKNVELMGQDFELLPFGSGRRMCPGLLFATQALKLTLANLLHGYDFRTLNNEKVDMVEGSGLTMSRETPLELLVSPRLPMNLYS